MRQIALFLTISMGATFLAGCTEKIGGEPPNYAVTSPNHPAMSAPASAKKAPATTPKFPAGHPPVPSGVSGPSGDSGALTPAADPGSVTGGDDGPLTVLGLKLDVPEGWVKQVPATRMRLAQFSLPRVDGDSDDGLLTVIPAAGSLRDNVSRWEGQFTNGTGAETIDRSADGLDVQIVAIEGTFMYKARPMEPGPGTPRPGYKLYAAVVQAPGGQLFFKGVGPKATMDRWKDSFDAMVGSFKTE